jgi:hypothetical protein
VFILSELADVNNPVEETQELTHEDPQAENSQADQSEQSEEELVDQDGDKEPADELEEVEIDGVAYKLPKDVASKVMMHADYTRKTQEHAENESHFKERYDQFVQREAATAALMDDLKRLHAIDYQIEQLNGLNFEQLNEEDAERARSLWFRREQLKADRDGLARELDTKNTQRLEAQRGEYQAMLKQGQAILNRPDPSVGWDKGGITPQVKERITQAAQVLGISQQELAGIYDPRHIKALNLVGIGLTTLQKARTVTAKAEVPPPKPVTTIGKSGKSPPALRGLDDRLSDEEWLERRRAQISRRG